VAKNGNRRWPTSLLRPVMRSSLLRAYRQVRVDPQKFLMQLRLAHRLPVNSFEDLLGLRPEVLRPHAESMIQASAKVAALEGAGLGFAGLATLLPDMGILSAITVRLLQKLSLLYGFEYATDEETAELWLAAASASGVDIGRDLLEKQATERLVPRVVELISVRLGEEVAEKWVGRIVPVLSAGAAAALNYYFVRAWGRRAQKYFEKRHRTMREGLPEAQPPRLGSAPDWTM
jgi:uncharacterized protein (DUF697 family)